MSLRGSAGAIADGSATPKRRVLFVDGDPTFGRSLETELRQRACDVQIVTTPAEAIAQVAATPPDLVVLDVHLPGRAALELLRLWKQDAPKLAVILVSGNASLIAVVDALNEGARGFLTKPVSAAALLDELDEKRSKPRPYLSPRLANEHALGSSALNAEGVDRFFAISPGLLSVIGFDGYFKMLNPAWVKALGYSIDELCAKPYLELVHPEDREKAADEALEICGGTTVFRFKNRYRCKDGFYRWLAWSATPSPAERLIYASTRDVTKSVRMEQGLRESNERLKLVVASGELRLRESADKRDTLVELARMKDELSAMIVHDLKNPLSVIVSNYDYILEGFEGSDDCLAALQDSKSAGQRMLRLLANLVDVARLETGTRSLNVATTDLAALVQAVADERRVPAALRKISITVAPCPELTAMVDADMVTRAVENILDNAFRYTPSGGCIEIDLRAVGTSVELRIANSGTPIPLEARSTIFDKYKLALSGAGPMNLGLGLHFCRLAIEAQGGEIWVEETARMPTVFGIRLPTLAATSVLRAPATPAMARG